MKKCPTCEKTYDDALRFCQADGTPLVSAEEPLDPYKTMVARPDDIAAALGTENRTQEQSAASEKGEVLEIPKAPHDPKKTMFASEEEIRRAIAEAEREENSVMDLPPLSEPKPPEFIEQALPKTAADDLNVELPPNNPTTPPIPSPFDIPKSEPQPFEPPMPEPPAFVAKEVEPQTKPSTPSPFDTPFATPSTSAPPAVVEPIAVSPAPEPVQSGSHSHDPGTKPAEGQNKILPIVSLVAGILSLCCWISPITGLVAIVTGFLGMRNAGNDPVNYGGKGLAITGMILGALFFLIGIAYWIFVIFFNGMGMIMQMMR